MREEHSYDKLYMDWRKEAVDGPFCELKDGVIHRFCIVRDDWIRSWWEWTKDKGVARPAQSTFFLFPFSFFTSLLPPCHLCLVLCPYFLRLRIAPAGNRNSNPPSHQLPQPPCADISSTTHTNSHSHTNQINADANHVNHHGFLFPSHPSLSHFLLTLQTPSLPQDQLFILFQVHNPCALSVESHCWERRRDCRRAAAGAFFPAAWEQLCWDQWGGCCCCGSEWGGESWKWFRGSEVGFRNMGLEAVSEKWLHRLGCCHWCW